MESNSATLEPPAQKLSAQENRTPPGEGKNSRAAGARRLRPRTVIFTLLALGLLSWGVHFGLHAYHYESTDDAYVVGHLHRISAQVSAQVKELRVEDNQTVSAGQILAVLDPTTFQVALDKAKAAVAEAEAQQQQAHAAVAEVDAQAAGAAARVDQAEAQLGQFEAQSQLARTTLARTEQLFSSGNGASTQADLDAARSASRAADAQVNAAKANIEAANAAAKSAAAARQAATARENASAASVAAAKAAVHEAEVKLGYTTLTAPVAGRIGNRSVEIGNRVQEGQALFALAANELWVVANFKETQLARMKPGEDVELTIDALPGEKLTGTIESLSPASGAQFALLPADNATGNFNKVVQRVPVKITFTPAELKKLGNRLRLGLSAVVDVRVR